MPLFELKKESIAALPQKAFSVLNISERGDIQRLLKEQIDVIAPDTLIIAEELSEWDESLRRIDLLGIDREANLIVIELKRTEDGGHMELQAIRYAAMISTMSFSKAVEVFSRYLKKNSKEQENAEAILLQFLDWKDANAGTFGQDVRIILVSADFSKEITTSVLWLNEHELDIRCVRLRPYALDGRVILDVQQIIPLPEAMDYTLQIQQKLVASRQAKHRELDFSKYDLTVNGTTQYQLTKRALVLETVRAAFNNGLTLEALKSVLQPSKWISVEGMLHSQDFKEQACKLPSKQGSRYNLDCYFCEEEDLFRIAGRTYALTNQWSIKSLPIVDKIIELLPPGKLTYVKSDAD